MDRRQLREELALKHRILMLDGKVTDEVVDELKFLSLALVDRSLETIRLVISSMGGNVMAAFIFYDFIRTFEIDYTGIVNGHCGSAAIPMMLGCKKRLATRRSQFYIHNIRRDLSLVFDRDEKDLRRKMEVDLL